MKQGKCPICGCKQFYVKNPDDEYDIYQFECKEGKVCFDTDMEDDSYTPEIGKETETFCNDCAWHDKFDELK